ncbi:MAG: type II toxin-antitoxin system VapC family toxin [Chloroflexota bacterium]|nr:type II toxin-antitoxin system VapC family toxin [Chloroflexota bacterium]
MRLLLDTHALLWWLADVELSAEARQAIADPANEIVVSAASAWEISIKQALNKLSAPDDLEEQLESGGFESLSMRVSHALAAGALPRHHDDPFDRMLVAQAQIEGLTLVTRDEGFAAYGVRMLRA